MALTFIHDLSWHFKAFVDRNPINFPSISILDHNDDFLKLKTDQYKHLQINCKCTSVTSQNIN